MDTLFEVQGAKMHSADAALGGNSLDYLDRQVHTILFDCLVVVLRCVISN